MNVRRALAAASRVAPATWVWLALVQAAGCAWISGLDNLQEVPCVGECTSDSGPPLPDSPDETSNDASTTFESGDGGPAEDDTQSDGSGGQDGDGTVESSNEAASESGNESGTEARADGSVDATADAPSDGPRDAASDSPKKCGSNPLKPNAAVALSVRLNSVASNAIDGVLSTRWESMQGIDPEWIYVDFGSPVYVNEVQILWEDACAKDYQIQVSNDAGAWMTLKAITGNNVSAGGVATGAPTDWTKAVIATGLSRVARYVRMFGTARCNPYGYSLWEMRFFGDTDATCMP